VPSFSQPAYSGYPTYPADVYTTEPPHLSLLAGWADEPTAEGCATDGYAYADAWTEPATGWSPGSRSGSWAERYDDEGSTDASWRLDALCAETDPEAFFPEKGGSTREAKRVCSGCAVRAECLEYALANDERFGIWGGLSERERRRVRLARRMPLSA
jgi:WhiB family redox-sensing transcriptional regulator